MNKFDLQPVNTINVNKFLDTIAIVERLAKKKSDIYKKYYDWIILNEEKLELQLIIAFDNAQKDVLKKLKTLENVYSKQLVKECVIQLSSIPLEPRVKYTTVGITRFKEHTFSVEMRNWLEKSGLDTTINNISFINPDPFNEAISNSVFDSYNMGGQTVFSIFDANIDFALRDKNVEKYFNNYIMKLSDQVGKEISSKIKYTLLEAIKNGDSIPHIRQKILDVWNKPIDVKVPPKLSPDGTIIRQGYSYQMSPKHWANTVARTEVNGAYNEGRLEGFKQSGVVDRVQFSTSPDERLCPICAGLEGMVYKLEQASGVIPQHANCRCQWIPLLTGETYTESKIQALANIQALQKTEVREHLMKEQHMGEKVAIDVENRMKSILGVVADEKLYWDDFVKAFNTGDEFKVYLEVQGVTKKSFSISGQLRAKKDYGELHYKYANGTKSASKIYNSGDQVGHFKRTFSVYEPYYNRPEGVIVHHDLFFLDTAFQNRAVGKELFRNQYEFYVKHNIKLIEVMANGDVGLYAWAKYGFDFDDEFTLRYFQTNFKNYITEKTGGAIIDTKNFKHSWDFATYNKKIGNVQISGKDFMLKQGEYWSGVLDMTSGSINRQILADYIGIKP